MSTREFARIVSRNLRRIASDQNRTQADISRDLRLNKATVSSWMNGTRVPKMENIDMLCHYFNVTRADIMEEDVGKSQQQDYYTDQVTAQIAEDMATNPNLKMLYDVQRDMDPEDLQAMYSLAMALKRKTERLDSDDPA